MFDVAQVSRAGGRARNEDACGAADAHGLHCWVLADGLGGHQGGEVAARLAVETVLAAFRAKPGCTRDALAEYVTRANDAVVAAQQTDARLQRMRSTLVVLVADDRQTLWAHVGDARLYRLEGGRIRHRTRDHSVTQAMVDAGEITAGAQAQHEDRDRLLRAVGQADGVSAAIPDAPEPLHRGDAFLLCSDGFWQAASDTAIEIDLAASSTADEWMRRLEQRVVRQLDAESDNYTAMAVRVNDRASLPVARPASPPTPPSSRAPQARATGVVSPAFVWPLLAAVGVGAGVVAWRQFGAQPTSPPVTTGAEAASGASAPATEPRSSGPTLSGAAPVDAPPATSTTPPPDAATPAGPAALDAGTVYVVALARTLPTLDAAIDAAGDGDDVWLGPGRHAPPRAAIRKVLHLRGAGRNETRIDAGGGTGLVITAADGSLRDLAVCCTASGPVLEIGGRFAGTITRVRLESDGGVGLLVRDTAAPIVEDAEILGAGTGRIVIRDEARPELKDLAK